MKRCPCEFTEIEACSSRCTCRTPVMSGGCRRCVSYGSHEQQVASAQALVGREKIASAAIGVRMHGSDYKDGTHAKILWEAVDEVIGTSTRNERRQQALGLVMQALAGKYPVRWTTCRGDFSGRETTMDVFNVPVGEQRSLLRQLRDVRPKLEDLIGSRCQFIFHTPEATKEHYTL